jgi:carboxyl-terminal processing protease
MKSKIIFIPLLAVTILCIIGGTFLAGFTIGNSSPPLFGDNTRPSFPTFGEIIPFGSQPSAGEVNDLGPEAETPEELSSLFIPFWESWKIVHDEFVDQPLDDEVLLQGAIHGMLDSLGDPYTSYLDPNTYFQLNTSLEGGYQGIGAWVDTDSEFLTIISPMPDSPAEKAGLEPGDEVIAIDGEDMAGIDGNLVIRRVLGPAGTSVLLTIRRESVAEPFDVEIVRAEIVIPSVRSEMLEGDIGYIQLFQFGNDSAEDLRAAIRELGGEGAQSLILDLRYNGGGLLTSAINVTSEFISDGVVLYQEYGDGTRDTHEAISGGLATEIPLIVLINEGSASASEILAGAIQDYERGLLVGTTSFGKGSVQLPIELSNDQGAIRVTIARWLTPNERQIAGIGIKPDVIVELTDEDIAAEQDTQLEKAIELLSE